MENIAGDVGVGGAVVGDGIGDEVCGDGVGCDVCGDGVGCETGGGVGGGGPEVVPHTVKPSPTTEPSDDHEITVPAATDTPSGRLVPVYCVPPTVKKSKLFSTSHSRTSKTKLKRTVIEHRSLFPCCSPTPSVIQVPEFVS